jgi:hypothetical protein
MRLRTPIYLWTFYIIGATACGQTFYCYGDVCDTHPPLPVVRDRHVVRVPPAGPCLLDGLPVPCPDLGPKLRAAYPTSNPQIGVCPDRETSFARFVEAQKSIGAARLLCVDFDCDPGSIEWSPVCRDLPILPPAPAAGPSGNEARIPCCGDRRSAPWALQRHGAAEVCACRRGVGDEL